MNVINAIATLHINHIKAKTQNLIIQCTIDPASPLNPNSPTIAKAILKRDFYGSYGLTMQERI